MLRNLFSGGGGAQAEPGNRRESAAWGLEDGIERLWRKSFDKLPVCKDLHRLATRTTVSVLPSASALAERHDASSTQSTRSSAGLVEGGDEDDLGKGFYLVWYKEGVPVEDGVRAAAWGDMPLGGCVQVVPGEGGAPATVVLWDEHQKRVTSMDSSRVVAAEDSRRYYALLPSKDYGVVLCHNCEDQTTADLWCSVCNVPFCSLCGDVLHRPKAKRSHERERCAAVGIAFTQRPTSFKFLRQLGGEPIEDGASAVATSGDSGKGEADASADDDSAVAKETVLTASTDGGASNTMTCYTKLVRTLTKYLESAEVYAAVDKELTQLMSKPQESDFELFSQLLFQNVIKWESKTAKLLKSVHQGMVMSACVYLARALPDKGMTKDYSGPLGWRVSIDLSPDLITVSHIRREQSLPVSPADEQYWFEYVLQMTFDAELTVLYAATLRITDLGFFPDKPPNPYFKQRIEKILGHGNLML